MARGKDGSCFNLYRVYIAPCIIVDTPVGHLQHIHSHSRFCCQSHKSLCSSDNTSCCLHCKSSLCTNSFVPCIDHGRKEHQVFQTRLLCLLRLGPICFLRSLKDEKTNDKGPRNCFLFRSVLQHGLILQFLDSQDIP